MEFVMSKKRKLDDESEDLEQKTVRVKKNLTFVPLQDALGDDWTEEKHKVADLSPLYSVAIDKETSEKESTDNNFVDSNLLNTNNNQDDLPTNNESAYVGKCINGQKSGRGKLLGENDEFIEGEWINDRLVQLHNAQFQISNNHYVRLYGMDNLYTSTNNNFVARIVLPSLNIRSDHFHNIRKEIESNIVITKILDDVLKANLEKSREKFDSVLKLKKSSITISRQAQRDMFHLFLMMKTIPRNHSNENENVMMLNKIASNELLSETLRNSAGNVCQDEQKFADRNNGLFLMNHVEIKYSWIKTILDYIKDSCTMMQAGLLVALPTRTFISSGYEDVNKLQDHQLFTCSLQDIQLFSDMELTTRQYSKTEILSTTLQDFIQNFVGKLWASFINKINKSNMNDIPDKSTYTNTVFLQLFKTFVESLNSVCDERKEDIFKIINIGSNAELRIIKKEEKTPEIHEKRLIFLISLMNHFTPGNLKNLAFKYNFSFFKINENLLKKLSGLFVNYFNNSLTNIPQEFAVWLYYIHTSFSDMFCGDTTNNQELFSFLNSLMNIFKIVIENQEITLEKVRILANSIIKFGTTISPYFSKQMSLNEEEMNILLKQAECMKSIVTSSEESVTDVTSIVDIFQVFWEERKILFTDLKYKYSSYSSAETIVETFNAFTQYIFNLHIYSNKFLTLLRSYNEFMRLLRGTNFSWYIKKENMHSENFVKLINSNTNSYLVQDVEKFINDFSENLNIPRHYLFDLTKNLLSCVENFLQSNSWVNNDKLQAASELLLLMGRSLIDFNKLANAVDFQHFFALFTEPFQRVAQHSSDIHDFQRRLASLENYYKYTMELNVMSFAKALELCKQNVTSDSPINYTINSEQLKLSYKIYDDKFKKYIEKHILEPDFDIDEFAGKIRRKVKLMDISEWNTEYKFIELPKLLAGLSAVWSALESKDLISQKQVIKPHCIQILCVLRLLGADQLGRGVCSHLAQVLTGQGKSLVLSLLAAALALTGNQVRVVCYNKRLATRDFDNFYTFYKTFKIEDKIKYGTFKNMADEILNPDINGINYNLRELVGKLLIDDLNNVYVTEQKHSIPKTVLLIDEVDVFFSSEFYGNTFNPVKLFGSNTLADLQIKIWNMTADNINVSEITKNIQKYIDDIFSRSTDVTFIKLVRNSRTILNNNLEQMISDAVSVRSSADGWNSWKFKLRDDGFIMIVQDNGEHTTSTYLGYTNVFMYFKLKKDNFDHKNFNNYGYLMFNCGNVSYAKLPKDYQLILGVTGTLKQLSEAETRAVTSYGITRGSDMPTFFGSSKLSVNNFSIKASVGAWSSCVLDSILYAVGAGRAVLVFFEDEYAVEAASTRFASHLSRYSLLTGNEDDAVVAACVDEAGTARRVTLATRHMGRGVDFKANDSAIEAKGGVHVIQTFFSVDVKEETQIKGRTARKDNSGSYELIVCRKHLGRVGLPKSAHTYHELNAARLQLAQEKGIALAEKIEKSQQKHDATMKFFRSFYNYNPARRNAYLQELSLLQN